MWTTANREMVPKRVVVQLEGELLAMKGLAMKILAVLLFAFAIGSLLYARSTVFVGRTHRRGLCNLPDPYG